MVTAQQRGFEDGKGTETEISTDAGRVVDLGSKWLLTSGVGSGRRRGELPACGEVGMTHPTPLPSKQPLLASPKNRSKILENLSTSDLTTCYVIVNLCLGGSEQK